LPINIGLVTYPISKAGITPLRNLVEVLKKLTGKLIVITGNEGYEYYQNNSTIITLGFQHKSGKRIITKIAKYIWAQIRITGYMIKISREVDVFLFFIGGPLLVLPIAAAKLMKKKVVLSLINGHFLS
jgi:hypothetical protein